MKGNDGATRARRPVFLNPLRMRMPAAALLSIAHRISGLLLACAIPGVLYLLQLSLSGPGGYRHAGEILVGRSGRIACVLLLWALAHHFFAGIRYLLIDLDIGVQRRTASLGARVVITAGLLSAVIAGWLL